MKFIENFECEIKMRCDYGHDYRSALDTIGTKCHSMVYCGNETILDTYFDTSNHLLLRCGHTLRKRYRKDKSVKYNYKFPLEIRNDILVSREIIADTGSQLLDLGDPFHLRLPILSHLVSFLVQENFLLAKDSENMVDNILHDFSPQILLCTKRTLYIPVEEKWYMTGVVLVDRVECFKSKTYGEKPDLSFSELEMELWDGKVCPGTIDILEERKLALMSLGYTPTHESKYSYAVHMVEKM